MDPNIAVKSKLSREEYLEFERASEIRHEFINGEVFAMSGAKREHNLIAINFASDPYQVFEEKDCEIYVSAMRTYVPDSGNYVYPDITVVCGEPEFQDDEFDTLLNPILIVEILSESTEAYDRGAKFSQYRSIKSLREYVLVSQTEAKIEKFVKKGDGFWMLSEVAGLDAELELELIGSSVKLARIYRKVLGQKREQ